MAPPAIVLSEAQAASSGPRASRHTLPFRVVQRAKIVLSAAERLADQGGYRAARPSALPGGSPPIDWILTRPPSSWIAKASIDPSVMLRM